MSCVRVHVTFFTINISHIYIYKFNYKHFLLWFDFFSILQYEELQQLLDELILFLGQPIQLHTLDVFLKVLLLYFFWKIGIMYYGTLHILHHVIPLGQWGHLRCDE